MIKPEPNKKEQQNITKYKTNEMTKYNKIKN